MQKQGKGLLTGQAESGISALTGGVATRTYLKGKIKAKHEVVPGKDVKTKTDIHPLNPRNQEALTLDAVRDILPLIKERGVTHEGVAVRCPTTNKLLLLDASRRRFCCIELEENLPLWVLDGDVSDDDCLAIINDSQEVKRWSYPEHAEYLIKIAHRKGIDINAAKIEDLSAALSMGRESLRKRLEAYDVSIDIRQVFTDFEGIPNTFYSPLARVQRKLKKAQKNIPAEMQRFSTELKEKELTGTVPEIQKLTLNELEQFVDALLENKPQKREWSSESLRDFQDKRLYANVKRSPDRNITRFEFSRCLSAEKLKKAEQFFKDLLAE